jgi:hypothetical protein
VNLEKVSGIASRGLGSPRGSVKLQAMNQPTRASRARAGADESRAIVEAELTRSG